MNGGFKFGKSLINGPFSTAVLIYQRVSVSAPSWKFQSHHVFPRYDNCKLSSDKNDQKTKINGMVQRERTQSETLPNLGVEAQTAMDVRSLK